MDIWHWHSFVSCYALLLLLFVPRPGYLFSQLRTSSTKRACLKLTIHSSRTLRFIFLCVSKKNAFRPPQLIGLFIFCCHKTRSISHSSLRKTKQSKRPKNFVRCFVKWLFTWSDINNLSLWVLIYPFHCSIILTWWYDIFTNTYACQEMCKWTQL